MTEKDQKPEHKRTSTDIEVIVNILEAVNYMCWRAGVKLSVAIHDIPREVFTELSDYWEGNHHGIGLPPDMQGPLWMKRAAPDIYTYTREAPDLEFRVKAEQPPTTTMHHPSKEDHSSGSPQPAEIALESSGTGDHA